MLLSYILSIIKRAQRRQYIYSTLATLVDSSILTPIQYSLLLRLTGYHQSIYLCFLDITMSYLAVGLVMVVMVIVLGPGFVVMMITMWVNDYPRSRKICKSNVNLKGKTALVTGTECCM